MHKLLAGMALVCSLAGSAFSQSNSSPLIGKWDFNIATSEGQRAAWLGISDKGGSLDVWFQPTGGHVVEVKDFKVEGSQLTVTVSPASGSHPATVWQLTAANGKLTGHQKQGDKSTPLIGLRAPELDRKAPTAWTQPAPLFNGKDLTGWEPIGDTANNHWTVKDGLLVNEAHGANLRTTRTFTDFKVHFEVNCPQAANSGFYLRGRYEVQMEYEPGNTEPAERSMGSVYGRLAPSQMLPRTPGKWESFDVTLVGRTVTVVRNGVTVIDHKQIEGITGGALDANEGQPGPFYIQGDHTGGLKFRNITVSVPQKS
jgi:3-keto-disaccharide hydrolase